MAKSLLKKAKKAAKSVKKEVKSASSSTDRQGYNLRDHVANLADERRDCSVIWTVIKDDESYNREKIIALIKAKGYETLLGEIS